MNSLNLALFSVTNSISTTSIAKNLTPKPLVHNHKSYFHSVSCKASLSTSSSIADFDLYDLLGVDSSSDQSKIKQAYRTLQKRCHPDIAGEAGHDMAIILNEAYALLSDPASRYSYDKEHAKVAGLLGFTGKPIYSVWLGSESEQRACFVDEVKCIGCLKCALFAEKTFAIESVHGRARVIAQWADPEDRIQEAIDACPVDCISMVERSKLAALEFLMSKQPRGNVRVGAGNTGGVRVSNIFVDVDKFQEKFQEVMNKTSLKHSKSTESDLQKEARISAFQAIRAISNWLYWQAPMSGEATSQRPAHMLLLPEKSTQPNIEKLREAVSARKQARETGKRTGKFSASTTVSNEYWTPTLILPESSKRNAGSKNSASEPSSSLTNKTVESNERIIIDLRKNKRKRTNPIEWGVPIGSAIIGAIVRIQLGAGASGGVIQEHIGGSTFKDVVNSPWLQVILASVTWYLMGLFAVEFLLAFQIKSGEQEE